MIPSPYNLALFGWLVVFCFFHIGSHYACLVGLEFLPYSSGCPPTHRHLLASRCGSLCLVACFDREKKYVSPQVRGAMPRLKDELIQSVNWFLNISLLG